MARKADIQYVHHYYTDGSAAKKVAVKAPKQHRKPLPLFEPMMMEPEQKIEVKLDPVSLGAIILCAVLAVMMVVSLFQYSAAYHRNVELQEYVYALEDENLWLEQDYLASFELESVRQQALALGMIPVEQAQTVRVDGHAPARAAEPTSWQQVKLFLGELFA